VVPINYPSNTVYGTVHIGGAVANGRLYLMAFNANAAGSTATYEYDPGADKWTTKAPPPFGSRYAVAAFGQSLYLLASQDNRANPSAESRLAEYDPMTDIWAIRASLPGVWWSALAAANGKLYALGGVAVDGIRAASVIAGVNEYDPATDRWLARGQLGVGRHSAAAATSEVVLIKRDPATGIGSGTDTLYVIGGASSRNPVAPGPLAAVEAAAFRFLSYPQAGR
jgi:hypothetical protein